MSLRSVSFVCALIVGTLANQAIASGVKVAPYGTTKDGRPVNAFTLFNDKGASVTVLDYHRRHPRTRPDRKNRQRRHELRRPQRLRSAQPLG